MRGRPYIHAPGGLADDEATGLGVDLAADDEFLQVTARQGARRRSTSVGLDFETVDDAIGLGSQQGGIDPATHPALRLHRFFARQQQVIGQTQRRYRATTQAFFGDEVQAQPAPRSRPGARYIHAVNQHRTQRRSAVFTRERAQQFLLAVTRYAGNAQNLARTHLQADTLQIDSVLIRPRQMQTAHFHQHRTRLLHTAGQRRWLGADHQARQRRIGFLCRHAHAGHAPAAQNSARGTQGADFVQLVADIQNTATLAGQLAQYHKELFYGLRCQHRSRLIENQNGGVGKQSTDDFHPLHFANAERVHRPFGVNIQPIVAGFGNHQRVGFLQRGARLQSQPHVLGDRCCMEEIEMLKDHGHAQGARLAGVVDAHGPAIDLDRSGVHLHAAVDDFHQRGLARAVLA